MTGAIHQPHPALRDYLAGPMVGYGSEEERSDEEPEAKEEEEEK